MRIVVLSYNHPEITKKTVNSVLMFSKNILLVHNGSEKRHTRSLQKAFPGIEHLDLPHNRGFSGGANAGLRHAFTQDEWALFLTNDTQLVGFPATPSEASLVAPMIFFRSMERMDSCGGWVDVQRGELGHFKSIAEFQSLICHSPLTNFRRRQRKPYVPGTAFLIHQQVFSSGFDEGLHTYWEDVDFSLNLLKRNKTIVIDSAFQVLHSVGKTCHKDSFYTSYLFQRNRMRVCRRHTEAPWRTEFYLLKKWAQLYWRSSKNRELLIKAWRES